MITLDVRHDWTVCFCDTQEEYLIVDEATRYFDFSAEQDWRYVQKIWDGFQRLLVKQSEHFFFPSGLIHKVLDHLSISGGWKVKLIDSRVVPKYPKIVNEDLLEHPLRDYQREGANACLKAQRGILALPMGSGKTLTAISIIATLDVPTLILTNEFAYALQWQEEFKNKLKEEHKIGLIGNGVVDLKQKWTIGLVQTLTANPSNFQEFLRNIKCLVVEECHHSSSATWLTTLMSSPAPFRFGLSYTAFERSDKAHLPIIGAIGDIVYQKSVYDIRQYLSRPFVEIIHLPEDQIIIADWHVFYEKTIVENELRNQIIVDRALRSIQDAKPCLVFVARHKHGKILDDMLKDAYGSSIFHSYIDGNVKPKVRKEKLEALGNGSLRVLIATDNVAGEGKDVPTIKRLIVGSAMKAPIAVKQRVGRGMRPEEVGAFSDGWGGEFEVVDFADNMDSMTIWHATMRQNDYRSLGSIISHNHSYVS